MVPEDGVEVVGTGDTGGMEEKERCNDRESRGNGKGNGVPIICKREAPSDEVLVLVRGTDRMLSNQMGDVSCDDVTSRRWIYRCEAVTTSTLITLNLSIIRN